MRVVRVVRESSERESLQDTVFWGGDKTALKGTTFTCQAKIVVIVIHLLTVTTGPIGFIVDVEGLPWIARMSY